MKKSQASHEYYIRIVMIQASHEYYIRIVMIQAGLTRK